MSTLASAVEDYLSIRRGLGYRLEYHGTALPAFVAYLEDAGIDHVTTEAALSWATPPTGVHPAWWRSRLGVVRGFARYLQTIDPSTQIPPADLLPSRRDRLTPHFYSEAELARLLGAARALRPPWRALTFETLVGLLAVSGLRLGEALSLDRGDVDLSAGVLVVARAKASGAREVALHASTCEALRGYCEARYQAWPNPATPAFFVSARGARLPQSSVHPTFQILVEHACVLGPTERRRPRPHDLRHSFAVRTLLGWYRQGVDVDARLPLLSTHLGHSGPAATYWYLEAVPELLSEVAQRLEGVLGAGSGAEP
jgi:integrase/recombinase XerD